MTTPWKAPRPWRGKECLIELGVDFDRKLTASLWRGDHTGSPSFVLFEAVPVGIRPDDGTVCIHTDPRRVDDAPLARYMREGVMAGLEKDATALPGRFLICQAIGLAVHLGASRVCLSGTVCVSDRARRNLETMVRPLKGARVYVFEPEAITGLFPKE